MAEFVKKTWACGDDITANDLNRMEDGIEEALDKGYECTEGWVTLTDESVTTAQDQFGSVSSTLAYSTPIDADTIKVTFDGTEYTCDKALIGDMIAYGGVGEQGPDFSEYPFAITSTNANLIYTETAGTYQVKIEAFGTSVTTTPCFEKAVKSVSGSSSSSSKFVVTFTQDGSTYTADHTLAEVLDAYNSGKVVEGAYKINAEGETLTNVYTLAFIESTGVLFSCIERAYTDADNGSSYIVASQFRLDDSDNVEYTSANISLSN